MHTVCTGYTTKKNSKYKTIRMTSNYFTDLI